MLSGFPAKKEKALLMERLRNPLKTTEKVPNPKCHVIKAEIEVQNITRWCDVAESQWGRMYKATLVEGRNGGGGSKLLEKAHL